ncbi:hypothetical protein EET67_21960 [Pseudaminobacter arsenicus]|uniref:Uncharacterized protein n=1 Tax=Borborobacter arsenicus TaxID=1851146 RepID=A0A432V0R1_9HYPH|nr:hypothetical protein [Pseudaminobacter arsenicus]RUM95632.1 hypothetical protein EET67_21960 [Pseudaminobacter arsenicus]
MARNIALLTDVAIEQEAAEAAARYGEDCFDLICIMSSRGDTLSDAETLELLRHLNRFGSIFTKVIGEIDKLRNEKNL